MADGILAYFTHGITNAVAEEINNKTKVLKTCSYGFHAHEYFFLTSYVLQVLCQKLSI